MERLSMTSVSQDIDTISVVWETFSGIHGLQPNISNLDIVGIFENISDRANCK
jgi:hypothetical protein